MPSGFFEEQAGLSRRPHHHRRRARHAGVGVDRIDPSTGAALLFRLAVFAVVLLPGTDSVVGPHQRSGPGLGRHLQHGGRVEVEGPVLPHGHVERAPQGGADAVHGGDADRPPVFDALAHLWVGFGAAFGDGVVELLDLLEHQRNVADLELIQPQLF
ncbi:hypothetical protein [Nonomuraea sp. JJY05]|uniref:hypothetical protein n=1 Tax=Nonomuraea sp. JJY05 TaxID=3350255 RepID=UPI00373F723E